MTLPAAPPGWLLGVDISQAQGEVDVPALVEAGVAFALIKATDGINSVDKRWTANVERFNRASRPFAPYGVIEPYTLDKADAQADNFVRHVRDSGFCLPPALDFERSAEGIPARVLLEAAVRWLDVAEQALARRCLVYASPFFILDLARLAGPAGQPFLEQLGARPLWIADYRDGRPGLSPATSSPRVRPPWSGYAIWQVGPAGATLPGTHVPVDVDYAPGTLDELRALGCPGSKPQSTADPEALITPRDPRQPPE